jgi:hypothetical protein
MDLWLLISKQKQLFCSVRLVPWCSWEGAMLVRWSKSRGCCCVVSNAQRQLQSHKQPWQHSANTVSELTQACSCLQL